MFVVNLKLKGIKKVLIAFCVFSLSLYGLSLISSSAGGYKDTFMTSSKIKVYSAATNAERINFLKEYGWETGEEPTEVSEIIIPSEFNDTYENYNNIQKAQNLDLKNYKGKRVRTYRYEIKNYPETEKEVYANLLVYNGMIIGGDVSSPELGGFMHGFEKI